MYAKERAASFSGIMGKSKEINQDRWKRIVAWAIIKTNISRVELTKPKYIWMRLLLNSDSKTVQNNKTSNTQYFILDAEALGGC